MFILAPDHQKKTPCLVMARLLQYYAGFCNRQAPPYACASDRGQGTPAPLVLVGDGVMVRCWPRGGPCCT